MMNEFYEKLKQLLADYSFDGNGCIGEDCKTCLLRRNVYTDSDGSCVMLCDMLDMIKEEII